MEKGSLRCDANISVRKLGSETYGTRVEVKNVNSVKFLIKAINYETERQIALIESGEEVLQETRLFDSVSEITRSMRSKENSVDYRYFPDPDLLPLIFSEEYVEEARNSLPELPNVKLARYVNELGLSLYDAEVIVSEQATAKYFEEVSAVIEPKIAVNWIIVELFAKLNKLGINIENSPIKPEGLIELLELVKDDTISGKIAKQVFELMFEEGKKPKELVEKYSLRQVTNTKEIETIVNKVIEDNPAEVAEYRSGRDKLFGFFVGQVMKLSKGKASPELVNNLLRIKLDIKQ
jgi:aspartyl-tRNA(Asn)/glutamyl-tRNA(Gln) amidotransferase subunit B